MRRFPVSWDRTLAALGYRRRHNRVKRDLYRRKGQRIEPLEARALLSATPAAPVRPEYEFVASADFDPSTQFELATEYNADTSAPKAVIRLRADLGPDQVMEDLQEIDLQLRIGDSVLGTQRILVDIAESEFLGRLNAERMGRVATELEDIEETSAPAGGSSLTWEELLEITTLEERRDSGWLGGDQAAEFYDEYRLAVEDAAYRETYPASPEDYADAAEQRHLLTSNALLAASRIRIDGTSAETVLSDSARRLQETLVEHGESYQLLFSGLGNDVLITHQLSVGGSEEFVIALVDSKVFDISEHITVDLLGRPAMIEATVSVGAFNWSTLTNATSTIVPVDDVVVNEDGTPSDPVSATLDVGRLSGSGSDQHALLRFNLDALAVAEPDSVTLRLDAEAVSSGGVEQEVAAHWDAWELTHSGIWDASQIDWASYIGTTEAGFGEALATASISSAGQVTFDVTDASRRALLAGDVNADGIHAPLDNNKAGDVEAMYLAARDWDAYAAQYKSVDPAADDLGHRADINRDGLVERSDFSLVAHRLGFLRGDFDLDGDVDGADYARWHDRSRGLLRMC